MKFYDRNYEIICRDINNHEKLKTSNISPNNVLRKKLHDVL